MRLLSDIELDPEVEPLSLCAERVLNIRGTVSQDGDNSRFYLAFTNQKPFMVDVPFRAMPAIFAEIRHAQALMVQRQRLHLDGGAEKLLELAQTALRVANVEFLLDPLTADLITIHQFEDHAPMAVRVGPLDLQGNLQRLAQVVNQARH